MQAVDTLLGIGGMSDLHFTAAVDTGSQSRSTLFLFLSLYLLFLAFFIMLVSISTLEDVKSKVAMQSLTAAFNTVLPSTEEVATSSEESGIDAGQAFQEEITGMFATSLQVAKVEAVQPARVMLVKVPTDTLFIPGRAELKPIQEDLLERLVSALAARPEGGHHDLEFVLGVKMDGKGNFPLGRTLEIERADVFAREMLRRGAPPDSFAVGVEPGDVEMVKFWFFTRSRDDLTIDFKQRLKKPAGNSQ
jgi:flagellar motor protein MotB